MVFTLRKNIAWPNIDTATCALLASRVRDIRHVRVMCLRYSERCSREEVWLPTDQGIGSDLVSQILAPGACAREWVSLHAI